MSRLIERYLQIIRQHRTTIFSPIPTHLIHLPPTVPAIQLTKAIRTMFTFRLQNPTYLRNLRPRIKTRRNTPIISPTQIIPLLMIQLPILPRMTYQPPLLPPVHTYTIIHRNLRHLLSLI